MENINKNIQTQEQKENISNQNTIPVGQIFITSEYKWYKDRPTLIAIISGFFSSTITIINAFFK